MLRFHAGDAGWHDGVEWEVVRPAADGGRRDVRWVLWTALEALGLVASVSLVARSLGWLDRVPLTSVVEQAGRGLREQWPALLAATVLGSAVLGIAWYPVSQRRAILAAVVTATLLAATASVLVAVTCSGGGWCRASLAALVGALGTGSVASVGGRPSRRRAAARMALQAAAVGGAFALAFTWF
jgi:hypothetical protein